MRHIECVVPVSGGKDSQACLKLAVEEFGKRRVLGLFCDTQFEHPRTYQHIKDMSAMYVVEIVTVSGGSVADKVRAYRRSPAAVRGSALTS